MKKVLAFIVLTIAILTCFVACNEHEHNYGEWTVVTDPTCTEAGLEERVCECDEKETRPVTALGHTYDDEYDAICNECGYERTIDCKHDNPEKIEIVPSQSPTCQETGLTEGMKCTLCGTMVVPQAIEPVIDCIASGWIVDLEVTHTEDGLKHTECTMCGKLFEEQTLLAGQKKMEYTLLSNNTYKLDGLGECIDENIVIPSEYNGLPVTSIGDFAFRFCTSFTSVVIPDSVTSIGWCAFGYCTSLSSVVIPDSVTSIGDSAFSGCTSLSSVVIPDSVTSIGDSAFRDCTCLTSVVIPDSVTSIGRSAFSDCTSLSSVVIPDSVTSIGNYAFYSCTGLSSVVIGDSVTSIGDSAFYSCTSLSSAVIGDNVATIGGSAFAGCSKLQFNEYENCKYLGSKDTPYYALIEVTTQNLSSYTIHGDAKVIAGGAFNGCTSLSSVVIPDSVTSIGDYAFQHCASLSSVVIPDSVTSIGDDAFRECYSLSSVVIPDSVTSIGDYAFLGCTSLSSVVIPDSVTSIGGSAFVRCTSLSSVVIPDSVTFIGEYAFGACTSLSSVVIPDSVTSIGYGAFYYCNSLQDVYYTGSEAEWKAITIDRVNSDLTNVTIHYNYIPEN